MQSDLNININAGEQMDQCNKDWFRPVMIFFTIVIISTMLLLVFAHLIGQEDKIPIRLTETLYQKIAH